MKNLKFKIFNLKFSGGFTVLEVIVAIAILGLGLVVIMELFSGALRLGRVSKDYTDAYIYASEKMDEIMVDPKEGSDSGRFNDSYRWESEVTVIEDKEKEKGIKTKESQWQTYKVKVKVLFPGFGGEKKVELVTIKNISLKE